MLRCLRLLTFQLSCYFSLIVLPFGMASLLIQEKPNSRPPSAKLFGHFQCFFKDDDGKRLRSTPSVTSHNPCQSWSLQGGSDFGQFSEVGIVANRVQIGVGFEILSLFQTEAQ